MSYPLQPQLATPLDDISPYIADVSLFLKSIHFTNDTEDAKSDMFLQLLQFVDQGLAFDFAKLISKCFHRF